MQKKTIFACLMRDMPLKRGPEKNQSKLSCVTTVLYHDMRSFVQVRFSPFVTFISCMPAS